jgi:CheY-like chemotaxis protein
MGQETILAVDDNPMNLKLLRIFLQKRGYDVATAASGQEARAKIKSLRPRIVLMDLQLPEVDGLQLTRELKADPELRGALVLAVTSYAMEGDRERAVAAGCDGYFTKPVDLQLLLKEIQRHVAAEP